MDLKYGHPACGVMLALWYRKYFIFYFISVTLSCLRIGITDASSHLISSLNMSQNCTICGTCTTTRLGQLTIGPTAIVVFYDNDMEYQWLAW